MSESSSNNDFNAWNDLKRAEYYTKYRPPYQDYVIPWALSYFRKKQIHTIDGSKIPLAIDVACGGGQLTGVLAAACDRVIGVDISEAMLETARKFNGHSNVDYRIGSALELSRVCAGEKADILTVGTAITFFNSDSFFSEVRCCLKPGGVVAVFGYSPVGVEIEGREDLANILSEFFQNQIIPQFTYTVQSLQCHLNDIQLPFKGEERRLTRVKFLTNREGIKGIFMSCPQLFKNGMQSIDRLCEQLPIDDQFNMTCDVFGILCHS